MSDIKNRLSVVDLSDSSRETMTRVLRRALTIRTMTIWETALWSQLSVLQKLDVLIKFKELYTELGFEKELRLTERWIETIRADIDTLLSLQPVLHKVRRTRTPTAIPAPCAG